MSSHSFGLCFYNILCYFEPNLTLGVLDNVGPDYVTIHAILTLCDTISQTVFVKIVCGMCGCVLYRDGSNRIGVWWVGRWVSLNLCLDNLKLKIRANNSSYYCCL